MPSWRRPVGTRRSSPTRICETIASPLDFVGINVYSPTYVRAIDTAPGYEIIPFSKTHPRMESSWQFVGPEALYWAPRHLHKVWNVKEIYISENGCGAADVPASDGIVYDSDRIMFLRNYLTMLQRATSEDVPVHGYFLWSLFDNFEWADGYGTRFGLIHVDYATQKRTPKLSAAYYAAVIRRNMLAYRPASRQPPLPTGKSLCSGRSARLRHAMMAPRRVEQIKNISAPAQIGPGWEAQSWKVWKPAPSGKYWRG